MSKGTFGLTPQDIEAIQKKLDMHPDAKYSRIVWERLADELSWMPHVLILAYFEHLEEKQNASLIKRPMILFPDRRDLECLVKGSGLAYSDDPLVKKAGHRYNDQYGTVSWDNLSGLTEMELYRLYLICKGAE